MELTKHNCVGDTTKGEGTDDYPFLLHKEQFTFLYFLKQLHI